MVNATWSRSAMNITRLGRQIKETFRIGRVARLLDRAARYTEFPGGYSEREPPDPIPNSEVKTLRADDSVAAAMRK
jgi:hypothetical protein